MKKLSLTSIRLLIFCFISLLTIACSHASGVIVYKQNVSDEEKFAFSKPYITVEKFPVVFNVKTLSEVIPIKSNLVLATFEQLDYVTPTKLISSEEIESFRTRRTTLLAATKKYPSLSKHVSSWISDLEMSENALDSGMIRFDNKWMKPKDYADIQVGAEKERQRKLDAEKLALANRLSDEKKLREELDQISLDIQSIVKIAIKTP